MWIKAIDEKRKNKIYKGVLAFCKKFKLGNNINNVRLEVSALGIFVVEINGHIVPDYFMPAWTNYAKVVNLCEYDLTEYAREGENVLQITVAGGWYSGRLGYTARDCVYGKDTALYARIELLDDFGDAEVFESDESWECTETNIVYADFFDGQGYDFTKKNFKRYVVQKKDIDVPFRRYSYEPVRETELLIPHVVIKKENSVVYDFGKNFSGVVRFKAHGKRGATVTVKYGEVLDKNCGVYTENLRSAKATDRLKLGKGVCEFAPRFTYHGFRYCEIAQMDDCEITDLCGVALSQNLKRTGSFSSDNPLVNNIYENILNGQRSNFISLPIDCPQRDERIGWTGDAQIFCDTAMYNSDCRKFYENYLDLLTDDCLPDGRVPVFVPFFAKQKIEATAAAGWSDAITIMPYKHYVFYGDKSVINKCLPQAEKWCEYFSEAEERNFNGRRIFNYGDWLSAGEATDCNVINYCYLGISLTNISRMFAIVGDEQKSEFYKGKYCEIKNKFRKKYFVNGKIIGDTQTSYALSYAAGFMSAEDIKEGLVGAVLRTDCHLSTGFLGLRFLLPALCETGRSDLAYKILLQKTYPSWGYEIANGATTIWERWNGIKPNGDFFEPSMNSFNHYSLGSVGYWIYAYMLGVRVEENGVKIKPYFGDGIDHASGSFLYRGTNIEVEWKKLGCGMYEYTVKTDKNIGLEFDFNDKTIKKQRKSANEYTFTLG